MIPCGIVVNRTQNDVQPFLRREVPPRLLVIFQINRIRTKILKRQKLDLPLVLRRLAKGRTIAEFHHAPRLARGNQLVLARLPDVILDERFLAYKTEIRQRKRRLSRLDIDIDGNLRQELHLLALDDDAALDPRPFLLARQEAMHERGQLLRIEHARLVRKSLQQPITQK